MEKDVSVKNSSDNLTKKQRTDDKINKVILVQAVVCAFFVLLVFLTGKFSPTTFEFLKNEYNKIMSVDMSAKELFDSAKNTANGVMKSITPTSQAPADTEEPDYDEGGEDAEEENATVAVMAPLGKNDRIITPLHGRITSRYGYRTNPISGKYGLHTGLDIAADEGTGIVAAYNGVVRDTGYGEKKGNFVLMEHSDGTQTLYCHCSEVLVTEGSVIRAGELIALVGNTGWSTGPHLHFEIHIDGSSVDPLDYIKEKDGRV